MSTEQSLVPDRPLRLFEMLTATFRYMRRNPAATLGIGALLGTVTSTVTGVLMSGAVSGSPQLERLFNGEAMTRTQLESAASQIADAAPFLMLAGGVSALVQFAAMGVMTVGMVRAMRGEPLRPSMLWQLVPWKRILGINVVVFLAVLVVIGIPVTVAVLAGGVAAIVIVLLAALAAFVLAMLSTLAVPASIIEDLGVQAALRRAWDATRGAFLRTALLIFASLVIWDALGSIIAAPFAAIFGALAGGASSASGEALSTLVTGIVTGAITLPATAAMAVLIFTDNLRRKGQ